MVSRYLSSAASTTFLTNGTRYWAKSSSSAESFTGTSMPVARANAVAKTRDLLSFSRVLEMVSRTMFPPPTLAALASLSAMVVIGPGFLNFGRDATTSADT